MNKKSTIAMVLAGALLLPANAFAADISDFSDFPSDWSAPALTQAVKNGLLTGSNGKINAQGVLTRAELAAIVNRAFQASAGSSLTGYTDVSSGAWYYAEMAKAVRMGTFTGANGKLNPESPVTREQACAVLARAFALEDGNVSALSRFTDSENVSPWATGSLAAMVENGYLNGANGKLNPQANMTRAEFAQLMGNMAAHYLDADSAADKTLNGNVILRGNGALLDGVTINGDLIIADGTDGVMLSNVTVTGRLVIRGGAGGVKTTGTTAGKGVIVSNPADTVLLHSTDGKIGAVTVQSDLAVDGKLNSVTVTKKATVTVHKDASVGAVIVNAAGAKITGDGKVTEVKANADNISVSNKGTKVTAANGVTGVKAGDKSVQPGKTETVGTAASTGGGSSSGGGGSSSGGSSSGGGSQTQTEYTITFDANGGENAPAAMKTEKGVLAALPTTKPIREGWTFEGWSAVKDDASTKIAAGAKFTANTTVHALWTEAQKETDYTVTFSAGEGGSGSMAAENVAKNGTGEYTLPESTFAAPKDNVFKAWSVKVGDNEPVEKATNDTINVTADTTVTALWREAKTGEITIVGYEPIPTLECDYSVSYPSAYNLPDEVTLKLSNGTTVKGVLGYSWNVYEGTRAAGNTVTVRNTVDALADDDRYNNHIDRSVLDDAYYVTMQIKFTAPEDMLSIEWDKDKTYNWNENVTVKVKNYKGDASGISVTSGWGTDKVTLTTDNGLAYDASTGTLTIDSEKLLNGTIPSYGLSAMLYLGSTHISMRINYTTNRSVSFAGTSYGDAEYSNISRKQPFTTKVTFTNVPAEDAAAASFRFADGTAAAGIILTATDTENVYTLTVPFASVQEHLSNYYGTDRVVVTMKVRGTESKNIQLSYMGAPELKLDKNSYYAAENPVITLKNFSFDQVSADAVVVTLDDDTTPLVKDEDYTVDTESQTITLISEEILGTNSLDEAKNVTVKVSAAADEETATVSVPYKKDRSLTIANVDNLSPYVTAKAALSGSEEGYDGLEVYYGDKKIEGTQVSSTGYGSNASYFVQIPYASIKDYLGNNSVTLTAKLSGVQTPATFTVAYGTVDNENGLELPIAVGKIGDSYGDEVANQQDGLPKTFYTGTISLLVNDDSTLTVDDWKNMSAAIEKKDGDGTQVILGVESTATNWSTGGVKAVVLESLWNHQSEMLELFDFNDSSFTSDKTDWPVFTVTLYKAGYKTASVDVVLYKYIY